MQKSFKSYRTEHFTESVIREMTRLAFEKEDAINLAQGFPDFPAPEAIKEAAIRAIQNDDNQYSFTWGSPTLRAAVSKKMRAYNRISADPDKEITISCGATEGMIATLLALVNPGDEAIVFAPFYENYAPDTYLSGATRKIVTLYDPDWSFQEKELASAFNNRTKAIIINTPNNPTGKVFTGEELAFIAGLCQKWGTIAVTDEIYEYILYDGAVHTSIGSLDGMQDLSVTVNAASKTYSVTGWRVGYVVAASYLTDPIRKVHDFLTVCAPTPLQAAAEVALSLGSEDYQQLAADYLKRRDTMMSVLEGAGFRCYRPKGAYYIMTDIRAFGFKDDYECAYYLLDEIGIAAVPGSSFYHRSELGADKLRFSFSKKDETLNEVTRRFEQLPEKMEKRRPALPVQPRK